MNALTTATNHSSRMRSTSGLGLRALLVVLIALIASSIPVLAQGPTGTISGTIYDESRAVLPGAEVLLENVLTGRELHTVVTDEEGDYKFIALQPGQYRVRAELSGFTTTQTSAVTLEPNRNIRLDLVLTVAGGIETVTVTAGQELMDRESATLGTTVEHRRVEGLPLNGRDVLGLALLQPGVVPPLDSTDFGTGLNIMVNGQRGTENNISLDGSNNNEVAVGANVGVLPRPDAVEQFRLLTSNYEAEFGRNTGSIINVVTKGGTSAFHGNVRFFWRPTVLSAARYFDKARGGDPFRGEDDYRRTFERKEFGGNIGGPVNIPGVYDGSDRTFFFFDYEGRRQLIGSTAVVTGLPSAAERGGNFSASGVTLLDPSTGAPFPNNTIPSNRFSPIGLYYTSFLPAANADGEATVAANQTRNFDQFTFRFDHSINDVHDLTYTLNYFDQAILDPFAFGGADVPGFGALDLRTTQNHTVRFTSVVSPSLVNSFQFGYARNLQPAVSPQNDTRAKEIGWEDDSFVVNPSFEGPPFIQLFDRNLVLGNSIQGPQRRVPENFNLQESVSLVAGDHRLKFGFDGTKYKQDQTFQFVNQGIFIFSGLNGGNTTGEEYADLLIGNTPIATQFGASGLRDYRQLAMGLYAQDSWVMSPQFTLSLGLRWEYTSPITDLFDRVAYYRPGSTSPQLEAGSLIDMETGAPIVVPPGGRAPDGLVYVGDPDNVLGGSVPRGGINKDYNNFAPRIGIAYSPQAGDGFWGGFLGRNKTVFRAGFGVFYGSIVGDTALQQLSAPGYNGTNAFFFPSSGTLARPFDPDPYPNFGNPPEFGLDDGQIPNPFEVSSLEVSAPLTQMSRPLDPNMRTPYTYQYNVTWERAFGNDFVFSSSYVGNRSRKLYAIEQVNPSLGTFFDPPEGRVIPTPTPTNSNSRRLNPDFRIGLPMQVAAGNSWYNSWQLQLQKRYSAGLSLQLAYTWSKNITDLATFGTGNSTPDGNHSRAVLDRLDRNAGKGVAIEDVPHRFVASWIYDLPFARNLGGAALRLLDGWSVGGIATFADGQPFQVFNVIDTDGTGSAIVNFADRGSAPFTQLDPRQNDSRAFNADAFAAFGTAGTGFNLATDYRRGTLGPSQYRLHNGINNFNLIVRKMTQLWSEDAKLELRCELFNAFNHAQFAGADLNLVNTNSFGKFVSTQESRVIQLAARISF